MEDIETVLMQIISYSGDCKSSCFEAMDCFQKGDHEQANKLLDQGYASLLKAKEIHAKLLAESAGSNEIPATLFMVHAEDQMMSSETILTLARKTLEIIESQVLKKMED